MLDTATETPARHFYARTGWTELGCLSCLCQVRGWDEGGLYDTFFVRMLQWVNVFVHVYLFRGCCLSIQVLTATHFMSWVVATWLKQQNEHLVAGVHRERLSSPRELSLRRDIDVHGIFTSKRGWLARLHGRDRRDRRLIFFYGPVAANKSLTVRL